MTGTTNGGMAALQKSTMFALAPGNGVTLIDPKFKSIKKSANGVTLVIDCNAGRTLVLKKSAALATGAANWTDVLSTNVVASPLTIEVPKEENVRFYRATQN